MVILETINIELFWLSPIMGNWIYNYSRGFEHRERQCDSGSIG